MTFSLLKIKLFEQLEFVLSTFETASKERDLILAAELGKALLEKNEELRDEQKVRK